MPFCRASSLDRLLACSGGAVLGGMDEKSERAREAADWGTLVHNWKATGRIERVGKFHTHPNLFKRKLERSEVERSSYWPEDFIHEKALALDPTGDVQEPGFCEDAEKWKATRGFDYATGTCDGYMLLFGSTLWVDDLKTGRHVTLEEHESQLLFYALGICRLLDYRHDVSVTLTHWPRYPSANKPTRMGRVVTQDELKAFNVKLIRLRDEIRRREPVLMAGTQCTWCCSRSVCPEYARVEGN